MLNVHGRRACAALTLLLVTFLSAPAHARVTRIVIDETIPMVTPAGSSPPRTAYEQVAGRAFGELDPKLQGNAIIQDIELAKDADGKVRYVASFVIYKPVDMSKASGLMWHDVPNRGRVYPVAPQEFALGDIELASAWQGDNSGQTAVKDKATANGFQWLKLPVARAANGAAVTGEVMGRIVNRSGPASQGLIVQTNPVPYKPVSLDTRQAKLVSRGAEGMRGEVFDEVTIAPSDWAWAKCDAANPFPGTPDPTHICLKSGFDAKRLYQVVFTAQDPYVLGVGFAAWRDVAAFFKKSTADDAGTPNPIAKAVKHSISRGVSQSGNFLRGWLHLGFNQAEDGTKVHDGMWPIIAGRRIALNFRWAQPDGVLELYQAGSEGPQWWLPHPDAVRGLPAAGILDRCTATNTCPKIIEHFGSAEVWALKLTPEWVGTDAKADLPLPANVRRYYIASTPHGGGAGGFDTSLPEADFIMPVLDYDWGPQFNMVDGSGIPSMTPPGIKQALKMLAPKVDADGNELGGVPVVLLDAPLGTYLGWNVTADGAMPFHKGQICNYAGGMVPFARTAAQRQASNDPRLSLEERYGSHEGYVAVVKKAAARAVSEGFLLPEDATALITAADKSAVLR